MSAGRDRLVTPVIWRVYGCVVSGWPVWLLDLELGLPSSGIRYEGKPMEQPIAFTVDVSESRVKISGEIDVLTAPSMIEAVLLSTTAELDLSDVTFMDSTGVHALLLLRESRAALRITAVSQQVQHLLNITNTTADVLTDSRPCPIADR
jgi:anti-anti-sigma factor